MTEKLDIDDTPDTLLDSKRRVDVLSRLLEVSKKINSTLDMEVVVSNIIAASKEVMQADTASLLLMDKAREHLVFEVALGKSGEALKKGQMRVKVGQGIAGWVAKSGETLKLDDAYQDPRFSSLYDDRTGYRTRSILCVPLQVSGEVIGVAQVINKLGEKGPEPFSEEDAETFNTFSGLAAIAVNKAQLHQELLEKQRLEKEIELAQQIQQSFLTKNHPDQNRLLFSAANIPAMKVGGDFYDIFVFGEGEQQRIGVTIGDVSGKGVFAAIYMARFLSDFRFLVELASSPPEAFSRANDILSARSTRGMFITMIYVEYNPLTRRATLLNAGHHPPVFYDEIRARIEPIGQLVGPPLGILPGVTYQPESLVLHPGDGLIMYTDGVTEARNRDGEEYGLERLLALAQLTDQSLFDTIMEDSRRFIGQAPQHDDLTLVQIEATDQ